MSDKFGSKDFETRSCLLVAVFILWSFSALSASGQDRGDKPVLIAQAVDGFSVTPVPDPTILPTDTAGWGGALGRTRGLRHMEGPPDLSGWLFHGKAPSVERDPRYSFTGIWSYFDSIDQFLTKLENKVPALAKVTGTVQNPCRDLPRSMPDVPDLPDPKDLSKAPAPYEPEASTNHSWKPLTGQPGKYDLKAHSEHAAKGYLAFSRACQGFESGTPENRRFTVGTPGSQMIVKSDQELFLKVGRAYFYNQAQSGNLEIEAGRIKAVLPPGASGILDIGHNGVSRFLALTEPDHEPVNILDQCAPSVRLSTAKSGRMIIIAPEDSLPEDLIDVDGIDETIDDAERGHGFLLIRGRFSLKDTLTKGTVFQNKLFSTNNTLQGELTKLDEIARTHPWQIAFGKGAHITASVSASQNPSTRAVFMPTRGARYGRLTDNELRIGDGAILVKGAGKPVYISGEVNHEKILTEIRSGAVVMISAMDGRLTVLNLTDKQIGGCSILIPGEKDKRQAKLAVPMGRVAEFFINDGLEPASTVLSYKIADRRDFSNGIGMQLAQYDYLAALKRFNLSFALPSQDLARVLKGLAATAYMQWGDAGMPAPAGE